MAKHARLTTDEQRERLEENRTTLLSVLAGTEDGSAASTRPAGLGLTLERFVVDRTRNRSVPYEGSRGVERLLAELARTYPHGEVVEDGHLVGVRGALLIEGWSEPVGLVVRVGAGAQLVLEVGPALQTGALLDALAVFARQLHLAGTALGRDVKLVAQGYNPTVASPSDIVLVPGSRNALLNTHLARTGRYGRDLMRCMAATRLSLPVSDAPTTVRSYQLLAALAPLLAFGTDNTAHLRGADATQTPRMVRARVMGQADPARCGIVPGTFRDGFGAQAYERWLEGLQPILFSSDAGVTFSTGTSTLAQLMGERTLSPREATRVLGMAWPWVRWTDRLELCAADALPPRLAVAYAALVKGLMLRAESRDAVAALLGLDALDDAAVATAWEQLQDAGWSALVYDRPVAQLLDELAALAHRSLDDADERRQLDALTQLWEVRCVPRDLQPASPRPHQPHTREQELVDRYGEGALIPYDDLQGEPPAGSTAVLNLRGLV